MPRNSQEASFQEKVGQPGRMGVAALPKCKECAYWMPQNYERARVGKIFELGALSPMTLHGFSAGQKLKTCQH